MMKTMRVIVANDAPIITTEHCHFDVCQVVPESGLMRRSEADIQLAD
jgi:hypothetical protein